jgi:hypothetical protein
MHEYDTKHSIPHIALSDATPFDIKYQIYKFSSTPTKSYDSNYLESTKLKCGTASYS